MSEGLRAMSTKAKALFISHGGGPLPLLGEPGHAEMVKTLQQLSHQLEKPKAIIVVSAHWEAEPIEVISQEQPSLYYDYYGFPPESYEIQYPCKGNPELAQKVIKAGEAQGIAIKANLERGFDHGLFVPMKILFPEADVPCIQVSLNSNLDAQTHLKLGEILKSVLDDDVLLIGSGFSFHNMRSFFKPQSHEEIELNMAFENWLTETMTSPHLSKEERRTRFIEWDATKGARYCHPREEHLLPLHVCYGAMQQSASRAMRLPILGVSSSMYLWS